MTRGGPVGLGLYGAPVWTASVKGRSRSGDGGEDGEVWGREVFVVWTTGPYQPPPLDRGATYVQSGVPQSQGPPATTILPSGLV